MDDSRKYVESNGDGVVAVTTLAPGRGATIPPISKHRGRLKGSLAEMKSNNSPKNITSQGESKRSRRVRPDSLTGGIPLTPSEIESLRADLKAGFTEKRLEVTRRILRNKGIEPKG